MKKGNRGSGVGCGSRKMVVEQLEGRAMLAGNVTVSVSGGNLIVTGDNNDNAVLIQQTGPNSYTITGFDFDNGALSGRQSGPTTIRGAGTDLGGDARLVTGVRGNIIVDLKKGNDSLAVGNSLDDLNALVEDGGGLGLGLGSASGANGASGQFHAPANLIINMGDGNDEVVILGVRHTARRPVA